MKATSYFQKLARKVDSRVLAEEFAQSVQTIEQWKSGEAFPHEAIQLKVMEFAQLTLAQRK